MLITGSDYSSRQSSVNGDRMCVLITGSPYQIQVGQLSVNGDRMCVLITGSPYH